MLIGEDFVANYLTVPVTFRHTLLPLERGSRQFAFRGPSGHREFRAILAKRRRRSAPS
jgi:hypothetical protein